MENVDYFFRPHTGKLFSTRLVRSCKYKVMARLISHKTKTNHIFAFLSLYEVIHSWISFMKFQWRKEFLNDLIIITYVANYNHYADDFVIWDKETWRIDRSRF